MYRPQDPLLRHVTRQPILPQRHVPHQQTPLQRHVSVRQRKAGQSSRWGSPTGIAVAGRETPVPSRKPETKTAKRRTRAPLSSRRSLWRGRHPAEGSLEFRPLRGRCRSETGAPLPCALRADCIFTPTGVPRTSRPHPLERLRTHNRLQRHVPPAGPAPATCDRSADCQETPTSCAVGRHPLLRTDGPRPRASAGFGRVVAGPRACGPRAGRRAPPGELPGVPGRRAAGSFPAVPSYGAAGRAGMRCPIELA